MARLKQFMDTDPAAGTPEQIQKEMESYSMFPLYPTCKCPPPRYLSPSLQSTPSSFLSRVQRCPRDLREHVQAGDVHEQLELVDERRRRLWAFLRGQGQLLAEQV
jgi:hypothetical protein